MERADADRPGPGREDEPIVEVRDERDPLARRALQLIAEMFSSNDRQSMGDLLSEVAEARLGLLAGDGFHLLTVLDAGGRPMATAVGVYLTDVNAGFVLYLAVRPAYRSRSLARRLRDRLVECYQGDARRSGRGELAWVLGEVRADSPWLRRLVRERGAIPFDLFYYHPGMWPGEGDPDYVLYREPVGDTRTELPSTLVAHVIFSIYRRAYRLRYPLTHAGFAAMIEELESRDTIGVHPRWEEWASDGSDGQSG